jgi:sec-independent protein translocase protein TatB
MFGISWNEYILIAIVALIVIGPKELPGVLRAIGQWTAKVRRMAAEFQGQFQEAMREAEMADLKKEVDNLHDTARGFTSQFNDPMNFQDSAKWEPKPEPALEAAPPEASNPAPANSEPAKPDDAAKLADASPASAVPGHGAGELGAGELGAGEPGAGEPGAGEGIAAGPAQHPVTEMAAASGTAPPASPPAPEVSGAKGEGGVHP